MKNLKKLLFLGTIILTLVSCGKENESGGGSSSSGSSSNVGSTQGINFKSHSQLKDTFTKKSLTSGVSNGMVVYHVGPDFGGQNFGSFDWDFDIDFGFCLNFFGKLTGDCDNYGNGQGANLDEIVEKGEYKRVTSANTARVTYDLAISENTSNNGFNYQGKSYTRSDEFYKAMLNLDSKSVVKIVITKAQVLVANGSISADYVEYFYSDGSLKGYVVSNQVPLIANPIAITTGRNFTGALNYSGNTVIRSISVQMHDIRFIPQTGKYEPITLGTSNFRF